MYDVSVCIPLQITSLCKGWRLDHTCQDCAARSQCQNCCTCSLLRYIWVLFCTYLHASLHAGMYRRSSLGFVLTRTQSLFFKFCCCSSQIPGKPACNQDAPFCTPLGLLCNLAIPPLPDCRLKLFRNKKLPHIALCTQDVVWVLRCRLPVHTFVKTQRLDNQSTIVVDRVSYLSATCGQTWIMTASNTPLP